MRRGIAPRIGRRAARRFGWRRLTMWTLVLGLCGVFVASTSFVYIYQRTTIPDPNRDYQSQTTRIFYADGVTELGRFATQNRESIPYAEMPQAIKDAVVAAENRTFWSDRGIDPRGVARAAVNNVTGGPTQGASTITQQYVKLLYLTQERTVRRKAKEAFVSLKLRREKSKEDILEGYLNTVYFGRGAYGIEAAAQTYFKRPAGGLTLRQCAVLASLVNNPSGLDPDNGADNRARLKSRFDYVLESMAAISVISGAEARHAQRALPRFPQVRSVSQYGGQKGHVLRLVRDELARLGYSDEDIDGGGLRITTTLTPAAMTAAADGAAAERPKGLGPNLHVAVASVDPRTGALRGFYGGHGFLQSEINWATVGGSAGSTLQPFAVAAALKQGYSLADVVDGRSPYPLPDGIRQIENAGGRSYPEPLAVLDALNESVNTGFVDLTLRLKRGPASVVETVTELGIPSARGSAYGIPRSSPGLVASPSVALGSATVSPINLAGAYATLANGGVAARVHVIDRVTSATGADSYRYRVPAPRVLDQRVATELSGALAGVLKNRLFDSDSRGGALIGSLTGFVSRDLWSASGTAGTATNLAGELSSAWFVGYTPRLSTAVMYVRGDGDESMRDWFPRATGVRHAARTWAAVMSRVGADSVARSARSASGSVSWVSPSPKQPSRKRSPNRKRLATPNSSLSDPKPSEDESATSACADSSTSLVERQRPNGWTGVAQLRHSPTCGKVWATYRDPTLPNCGLPAIQVQVGVRLSTGGINQVAEQKMHSDLCRFDSSPLSILSGNQTRLRVGSYYCVPGSCYYVWGPWSEWVGAKSD
ncbi:MAG: transglycosylase domain-containing protein [Nocardioides sp.]